MPQIWTEGEDEILRRLFRTGLNDRSIANRLAEMGYPGRTARGVETRRRNVLHLYRERVSKAKTGEDRPKRPAVARPEPPKVDAYSDAMRRAYPGKSFESLDIPPDKSVPMRQRGSQALPLTRSALG